MLLKLFSCLDTVRLCSGNGHVEDHAWLGGPQCMIRNGNLVFLERGGGPASVEYPRTVGCDLYSGTSWEQSPPTDGVRPCKPQRPLRLKDRNKDSALAPLPLFNRFVFLRGLRRSFWSPKPEPDTKRIYLGFESATRTEKHRGNWRRLWSAAARPPE